MGSIGKLVIAFGLGIGVLTGVQHLWVAAMLQRIDAMAQTPLLPQSEPLKLDFDKTLEAFKGPQIDVGVAQRGWWAGQQRDIDLRNRAAAAGAPQIANGIPTMPGQGVPLQYYHPPGVPFH
jgi:hypothetical protein